MLKEGDWAIATSRRKYNPERKGDARLPELVPEPKVNLREEIVGSVQIKFRVDLEEARAVCSYLMIAGQSDSEEVTEQLTDEIKATILFHKRNRGPR